MSIGTSRASYASTKRCSASRVGSKRSARWPTKNRDVIADTLYEALDDKIGNLATSGTEEDYVEAVVSYHILGEGVAARTAQNLAASQYERYGDFPGLAEGQRHVARDEARHIGIGVTYLRQMLAHHPHARD